MDSDKKIVCIARGGLGNRLKSIYSCYALARIFNRELIIDWGVNQSFQAEFFDIFKFNVKLDKYSNYIGSNSILVAEKQTVKNYLEELNSPIKLISPNKFNRYENYDGNVLIFYPDYLPIISPNELMDASSNIIFSEDIISIANRFKSEKLTSNSLGVHLRLTDFERNKIKYNDYERIIFKLLKNHNRIFICSDSSEAELDLYKKYGIKILFYEKSNQPNKINKQLSWSNNISRNRGAIIDSCIDLLILSNTKISYFNRDSTFAHIAILLSQNTVIYNRKFLFRTLLEKMLKIIR